MLVYAHADADAQRLKCTNKCVCNSEDCIEPFDDDNDERCK